MPLRSCLPPGTADPVIAVSGVGDCVPTTFSGVVTAVYDRAVNAVVPEAEGGLVTLALAPHDGGPAGITVNAPHGFRFPDGGVTRGSDVTCRGGVLSAGNMRLYFEAGQGEPSSARGLRFEAAREGSADALASAVGAYEEYAGRMLQDDRSFAGIARVALEGRIDALAAMLAGGRPAAVADGVRALIGLGEGATPSGDDALVGLMLATALVRDPGGPGVAERALLGAVREHAWRTSDLSRSYLLLAAGGHFSATLLGVARVLVTAADDGRVRAAMGRAAAIGHSSGIDGLLGLLVGLQTAAGSMTHPVLPRGA